MNYYREISKKSLKELREEKSKIEYEIVPDEIKMLLGYNLSEETESYICQGQEKLRALDLIIKLKSRD